MMVKEASPGQLKTLQEYVDAGIISVSDANQVIHQRIPNDNSLYDEHGKRWQKFKDYVESLKPEKWVEFLHDKRKKEEEEKRNQMEVGKRLGLHKRKMGEREKEPTFTVSGTSTSTTTTTTTSTSTAGTTDVSFNPTRGEPIPYGIQYSTLEELNTRIIMPYLLAHLTDMSNVFSVQFAGWVAQLFDVPIDVINFMPKPQTRIKPEDLPTPGGIQKKEKKKKKESPTVYESESESEGEEDTDVLMSEDSGVNKIGTLFVDIGGRHSKFVGPKAKGSGSFHNSDNYGCHNCGRPIDDTSGQNSHIEGKYCKIACMNIHQHMKKVLCTKTILFSSVGATKTEGHLTIKDLNRESTPDVLKKILSKVKEQRAMGYISPHKECRLILKAEDITFDKKTNGRFEFYINLPQEEKTVSTSPNYCGDIDFDGLETTQEGYYISSNELDVTESMLTLSETGTKLDDIWITLVHKQGTPSKGKIRGDINIQNISIYAVE